MIIHEEPSPNSVSSPVSTAKDSRCYTVEDLMEMLLLSRPTVYRLLKQNEFLLYRRRPDGYAAPEPSHCLPSAEAERIPLVQGKRRLPYFQSQL